MKIAQVPQSYLPSVGGIQNYVYRLSRDLSEKGIDVDILTSDLEVENPVSGKQGKINVYYFHAVSKLMRNPITPGLIQHLRSHSYDLIHIHSLWAFSSLASAIFKGNARLVTTAHGVTLDSTNHAYTLFCGIYTPAVKYICRRSDRIIVLGHKEKEKLIDTFGVPRDKIQVVPNGIEIENPSNDVVEALKERYHLERARIILFTGRVSPIKNPAILVQALSTIQKSLNDVKLLLVGPITEEYRDFMNRLAEKQGVADRIIITGALERKEVVAAYAIADIFVSLGVWEGLPTTMLEAMSHGVPCIMYSSGGIEDVIKDHKTGMLINTLDPEGIGGAIALLLTDQKLYETVADEGKKLVETAFDWKKISGSIEAMYHSLVPE